MAIWNLGSINADFVYSVPYIPSPGETLAAIKREVFLGGKGANMSVAAARAGARVCHIGAIGADGRWATERLLEYGVDTRYVVEVSEDTAQAIIAVDTNGENSIILHPGANAVIPAATLQAALSAAQTNDWFVCQNETNLQVEGVSWRMGWGLRLHMLPRPLTLMP